MLVRDIVLDPRTPYLDKLILLVAPIFNADGNERISPENRRDQPGPAQGVGIRPNGQNLDLNRDSMKLESPETQRSRPERPRCDGIPCWSWTATPRTDPTMTRSSPGHGR